MSQTPLLGVPCPKKVFRNFTFIGASIRSQNIDLYDGCTYSVRFLNVSLLLYYLEYLIYTVREDLALDGSQGCHL